MPLSTATFISWAVSPVGLGPILGALLVLRYAPDTRGLAFEQIQDELDAAPA